MDEDEDRDALVHYGNPLPPLEEFENVPRKPIPLHEQIVTDENGKKRFHGAFTGGFSAGYWNTVGSEAGFQPKTFSSSRASRATTSAYNLDDILDDEDRSEFGIAPKRTKIKEQFNPADINSDVVARHLAPNPVDLGIRLLRRLGIRDGKGVGASIEKEEIEDDEKSEPPVKVYTCARPPPEFDIAQEPPEIEPKIMRKFKLAPDDIAVFVAQTKSDRKGIGYTGLHSGDFVSKYSSDTNSGPSVSGMRGQAFGVGAFEEEDDDIYAQDNIRDFDFELGPATLSEKRHAHDIGLGVSEGFVTSRRKVTLSSVFKPPQLPINYQPNPKLTRRFDQGDKEEEPKLVFQANRSHILPVMETLVEAAFRPKVPEVKAMSSKAMEKTTEISPSLEWHKTGARSSAASNNRFVSAGNLDTLASRVEHTHRPESAREQAARLGMYGKLTRTVETFIPDPMLCRRFNVKMSLSQAEINAEREAKRSAANEAKSVFLQHLNELPTPKLPESSVEPRQPIPTSNRKLEATVPPPNTEPSLKSSRNVDGNNGHEEEESHSLDSLKNYDLLSAVFGSDDENEFDETAENENGKNLDRFFETEREVDVPQPTKEERLPDRTSNMPPEQESTKNDSDEEFGPPLPPQIIMNSNESSPYTEKKTHKSSKKKRRKRSRSR